jgi:hypothetical protein
MRTIAATVSASGSAVLFAESAFPKRSRLNCWLLPFCSLLAFVGGITPAWPEGRELSLPANPLRAHAFGRISHKVIMHPTVSSWGLSSKWTENRGKGANHNPAENLR